MAGTNRDQPNGFEYVGGRFSDQAGPQVCHFDIASAVTGTIGVGQPCKLNAAGEIVEIDGSTFGNDSGATNGRGIFIAKKPCVASDLQVPFISARNAVFRIQGDDDWAPADMAAIKAIIGAGTRWGMTNPNAISTDGLNRSTAELDGNFSPTANAWLQIVGVDTAPDNYVGAHQKLFVRWHPACFANSPDHIYFA